MKWKRNAKNFVLLGILLLSLGIQLANQWDNSTRAGSKEYKLLKAMAEEIQPPQGYTGTPEPYKMLHHLDENGVFLSEKDSHQYEKVVDILYLLEDENTAGDAKDWQEQLLVQTERLTLQKEYMETGGTEWSHLSLKKAKQQLARNEWLQAHDLPIEEITESPKGIYFVYSLLRQAMSLGIVILMVALFFFDFLANEYERKTYLFMSVQPITKWQRYFRKSKVASMIAGGVYLVYLGLALFTASLFFGMGSIDYPILIEGKDMFSYVSIGLYSGATIILQLLFIVFLVQVIQLLSKVLKQSLEVLVLFLVITLLPNLLQEAVSSMKGIGQWLPLLYMNVDHYLTSSIGFTEGILIGISVLLLGNGLLVGLSRWVVKRTC